MKQVLLCLIVLLATPSAQDKGHFGKIAWELDPSAGLAKAKAQRKNALLYFTADW